MLYRNKNPRDRRYFSLYQSYLLQTIAAKSRNWASTRFLVFGDMEDYRIIFHSLKYLGMKSTKMFWTMFGFGAAYYYVELTTPLYRTKSLRRIG